MAAVNPRGVPRLLLLLVALLILLIPLIYQRFGEASAWAAATSGRHAAMVPIAMALLSAGPGGAGMRAASAPAEERRAPTGAGSIGAVTTSTSAAAERPRAFERVAAAGAPPPPPDEPFHVRVDRAAALPYDEGLSCHARDGYDLAGDAAFVWGLTFHVASAAECCAACAAHRRACAGGRARGRTFWDASQPRARVPRAAAKCSADARGCNAWVYCPGSPGLAGAEDRCFSYTIHNHSAGECWLKHEPREAEPIAHGPELPAAMVAAPRKAWPWAVDPRVWPWEPPRRVAWQSGILAPRGARVWQRTVKPDWHDKFCRGKHGPC